ncbi:hypothetical protein [Paraburkholderia sp. BCC1886]|uniref:hypothetical protein n=1 Tax=Paraburkholderia sp. BCC1886 TaxID=2562670 RepID=UPI001183370D|nr:hypothetical protein [Paraburkholderia sp. BCC1886]
MALPTYRNYYVIDRESNLALVAKVSYDIANFVGSSMLNTQIRRLNEVSIQRIEELAKTGQPGAVFIGKDAEHRMIPYAHVAEQARARLEQADIYATGIRYLLFHAGSVLAQFEQTCSLEMHDLPMFVQFPMDYAQLYAKCHDVPEHEALSQLKFDHRNMLEITLRRKELLWVHGRTLKQVTTRQSLQEWKTIVRDNVIGIGQV